MKKIKTTVLIMLLFSSLAMAQKKNQKPINATADSVFTQVDEQPYFNGGMTEFYTYIQANLTYPEVAKIEGIEGKVFVEFVVSKTGNIESAKILRGLSASCDKAVIELISNSPDWVPGKYKGQVANVRMVLPVTFKL